MENTMKKAFLMILLIIAAFVATDYVELTQSAEAGWGPAAGTGGTKGGSASRGRRTAQPEAVEEEKPRVELEWEEASVEYPEADEDVKKSKIKPVIKQFEKAFEQQKPVIIFVYTDDMRKKYESKRVACETYMNDVLCEPDVAEQLENFVRIKLSYKKIDDDRKLKSEYKLKKSSPYIAIYDFTGDQYTKTSQTNVAYIVSKLKGCIKTNEKEVKKLERKRER